MNNCSGHGKCLSMREIAQSSKGFPLQTTNYEYGYDTDGIAWDADILYTCVCDSTWNVGVGSGQTQLAEYFGPDCSQRKLYFIILLFIDLLIYLLNVYLL